MKIYERGIKMKNYDLIGKSYKANLHCHSTISDGHYTPEELKKQYMAEGYSIIAYTDHNVLIDHSDLCEEGFLALNGYELDVSEVAAPGKDGRTAHMCFIAKKHDNLTQVCYKKDSYIWGNSVAFIPQLKYDRDDYERHYSHEGVTDMMKKGKEGGFFVTYNHPTWSLESYPEYSGYEGMDAMEIYNTGCEKIGFNEYNCHCYDDLLKQGKRIYCIAADDNHTRGASDLGQPGCDCFGGWVCIFADKLEYETITKALEDGKFYASTGPEIIEFKIEDGYACVKTSPAHRINYITGSRRTEFVAAHYGEFVTEARFQIRPRDYYFRIDVINDHGEHANTNAIFTDTIFE